jgi:hypothetical protein
VRKIIEVEKMVAVLLNENEDCRNHDNILIPKFWERYNKVDFQSKECIESLKTATGAATIIRARQRLQAQGKFLPTNPEILEARKKQEARIRNYAIGNEAD